MRKIIYTRADGGVSVVTPVRNTVGEVDGITDDEIEQRAWTLLPRDAIDPVFVDPAMIPIDRTHRDAWVRSGNQITVDPVKAAAIDAQVKG